MAPWRTRVELDNTVTVIDPKTMTIVGTVSTDQPESHMLAISSDGTRGYAANVAPGTVSVLDLVNRKPLAVIPIATHTQRIALSVDDRWAFTSDTTRTIDVPPSPQEVLVRPDGKVAYVSCDVPGKVAAIRTSDWTVEKVIDAGKYADGLAWATTR